MALWQAVILGVRCTSFAAQTRWMGGAWVILDLLSNG